MGKLALVATKATGWTLKVETHRFPTFSLAFALTLALGEVDVVHRLVTRSGEFAVVPRTITALVLAIVSRIKRGVDGRVKFTSVLSLAGGSDLLKVDAALQQLGTLPNK
jgi:hypothetical protein